MFLNLAICGAPTVAASDLCGTTIGTNLELDHDLICSGNGLIVGADGIEIDLNGHTLSGAGSGVGVSVIGRARFVIRGGTVQNFTTGILVVNSSGVVIRDNHLIANGDGVDFQAGSVGNAIRENHFQDHRTRAIMLRAGTSGNTIKENTFTRDRVGILMFGAAATIVKENALSASGLAAIRINTLATGNLIVENIVASNPTGIEFIVTATGWATGNTLSENTLASNTCGLKGPTTGNALKENVLQGNAVDTCS
jgi:parallel beta-helix repeat protein